MFVRSVAGTTALAIDGDSLAQIRSNADAAGPAFQNARTVLARSREVNGLREEEIYILRPLESAAETEFVVMIQEKTFIGNRYRVLDENQPALTEAWQSGKASNTGLYQDQHGRWISAARPL